MRPRMSGMVQIEERPQMEIAVSGMTVNERENAVLGENLLDIVDEFGQAVHRDSYVIGHRKGPEAGLRVLDQPQDLFPQVPELFNLIMNRDDDRGIAHPVAGMMKTMNNILDLPL